MNRDEVEGKAEAVKGKAKKTVGRIANDPELESEGAADEAAGQTKHTIGRARRKAGEFIEEVGKQVKK